MVSALSSRRLMEFLLHCASPFLLIECTASGGQSIIIFTGEGVGGSTPLERRIILLSTAVASQEGLCWALSSRRSM